MNNILLRILTFFVKGIPNVHITAQVGQTARDSCLKEKTVLVTGGGRRLGFSIAESIANHGGKVIILGRNENTLRHASQQLNNCPYLVYDIQNTANMESLFDKAEALVGKPVDSLINNAGISLHEQTFTDVTTENFDKQFDTNIKGPYFLSQAFIKYKERKQIERINIVFITSERGFYGDTIPYGLTKVAVNSFTQGLARRYLRNGVKVNAIAPGVTASDMTGIKPGDNLYREQACGKRVFLAQEIAEVALFLLSDYSNCISGEILPCNQGNHLRSGY